VVSLRSGVIRKVLNYFFVNHHESLYVNELSRKLDLDKRNLVKKLKELESEGLLKSELRGNLKIYSINKSYLLYKEYRKIILNTVGLEKKRKPEIRISASGTANSTSSDILKPKRRRRKASTTSKIPKESQERI
jgi:DNA-binding transcriptional ArsR family regulator